MSMAQENQIEERPRRGRPRRVSDDVLRDQILTGAMNTFVEKGFAGATMSDIARRAHVSKRDLYRQFADKTELFTATIRSRRHLVVDLPRTQDETLTPLEALREIFRLDLDDREADERDAMLNLVARESLLLPDLNALLYDTGVIGFRELVIDWLKEQIARGNVPETDVVQLAGLLMDVVFGALLPRRRHRGEIDRAAQAEDIMGRLEIVMEGLEYKSRKDNR